MHYWLSIGVLACELLFLVVLLLLVVDTKTVLDPTTLLIILLLHQGSGHRHHHHHHLITLTDPIIPTGIGSTVLVAVLVPTPLPNNARMTTMITARAGRVRRLRSSMVDSDGARASN